MRLTCVTIVATLFVLHHAASKEVGPPCKTVGGVEGNCKDIKDCKLLRVLLQYGSDADEFLRSTVCGPASPNLLVCCPRFVNVNRKNNGTHDDVKKINNTEKIKKLTYEPLMAPNCGATESYSRALAEMHNRKNSTFTLPWDALLGYSSNEPPSTILWKCMGSLITSRHVMTTAYCATYNRSDLHLARFGGRSLQHDNLANLVDVTIEKATVHPHFDIRTRVNDIAILRLQAEVEFTAKIYPVCLPLVYPVVDNTFVDVSLDHAAQESANNKSRVWEFNDSQKVPHTSEEWCKYYFRNFDNLTIDNRTMCTDPVPDDTGDCTIMSGSPLVTYFGATFYVMGIFSYGFECSNLGYPHVYTRVTSFLDFIKAQLN